MLFVKPKVKKLVFLVGFLSLISALFVNCGGLHTNVDPADSGVPNTASGNNDNPPVTDPASAIRFSLSGSLIGLGSGKTVKVHTQKDGFLELNTNGSFTFASQYDADENFEITLSLQPAGQTCILTNAVGKFTNASITNIQVVCTNNDSRMYLTSGNHSTDFQTGFNSGIQGADAFCMADANRPSDLIVAKAMIVSNNDVRRACTSDNCVTGGLSEHIDWVFKPNRNYTLVSGLLVGTTDANGLLQFPLSHGLGNSGRAYFTGMSSTWRTAGLDCNNWHFIGSGNAFVGHDNNATPIPSTFLAAFGAGLQCTSTVGLVCVEQ